MSKAVVAEPTQNAWDTGFLQVQVSAITAALLAASFLFLAGCATPPFIGQVAVASYKPTNVHLEEANLPPNVKRVAVLPLTTLNDKAEMDSGREVLWPLLLDELGRTRLFELVPVSADELRSITGRLAWTGEERLPIDFCERLHERLGVDAVLFSRLTEYRAYQPLAIGWRLKLLEVEEPRILWSVDEFFDARVPEVAAAARRYAERRPDTQASLQDPQGALRSPRRFGQYTACAVLETLPGRHSRNTP